MRRSPSPDRVLATVLFTDMVGSTERAAEIGDRRWRELVARHHRVVRAELKRFRGREIDTAGDGFFATFERPARAIECALAIIEALRPLGLVIRAGVHAGELELSGRKVGGIAVHTAARVVAAAGPGEVLVTATVRDLVAGSQIEFVDRGTTTLKGVPGEWHLFAVVALAPAAADTDATPDPGPVAASRTRARLSRLWAIIGIAAVLALLIIAAAVLVPRFFAPPVVPGVDTVARVDAGGRAFELAVDVGSRPVGLAAGAGAVWAINFDSKTLTKVDPAAGHHVRRPRSLGRRSLSAVLSALLLLAACVSAPPSSPSATGADAPVRDGVLRLGVPGDFPPDSLLAKSAPDDVGDPAAALDPHRAFFPDSLELLRCCLVRTLLSYEGKPTEEGGTRIWPDLAESLPEVSDDGLTWTFKLRQGMLYAPPLQTVEITSADFVRSITRLLPGYPAASPRIEGLSEYLDGRATTISGLEAPDDYTLRVKLTRPQSDLPARLAFPEMAPIPPHTTDPAAPLGVATGHDADYGRFLVASGPYMVEGAEQVSFNGPPDQHVPASGFVPGKSLTLVRNPSWDQATDLLRPAFVGRIEIAIGGSQEELAGLVDSGELDLVFYGGPPPQSPIEQIERYRRDPSLGSVHANSRDFVRSIAINLGLPPFDDIHVRKAASLVINKARLIEIAGGPWTGEVAGHIVLNSLEDNLLLTYDPYRTPGSEGDLAAARAEMALSKYDADGDGVCDDPTCTGLTGVIFFFLDEQGTSVAADLEQIGIQADVESLDVGATFARWFDPAARTSFMVGIPYVKDNLNAASFFTGNFDSRTVLSDEETNGTLVGASADQLERWGYAGVEVPNIDDRIDLCHAQGGSAQVQCWAALDQYLMENVVPWIPYSYERYTKTVSARVVHYSFDQSIAMPALDQISVPRDP